MKIKRFFAADIRQALRQVREGLGADAVILSNKTVEGGVELVAALDYDETAFAPAAPTREEASEAPDNVSKLPSRTEVTPDNQNRKTHRGIEWSQDPVLVEMRREMQEMRRMMENELSGLSWRDMGNRSPQTQELFRRLMELDFSPDICHRLIDLVQDAETADQAWRKALYFLSQEITTTGDRLLDEGGVVALIGPTGVGKTTTIAKIAARYALRHGNRHVALVSTDTYRIGAQEQLNTYARILDVPIRTAANSEELSIALNSFSDRRLVLIDTAGMSQRDVRLSEQLAMLHSGSKRVRSFLTLSATTQQSALEHAVQAFGVASPEACVLTKVDEAASLGGTLSALMHSGLPLAFIADGQKVPEDLHLARAHTLVSRAASLAQHAGEPFSEEYLALALGGTRANAHG